MSKIYMSLLLFLTVSLGIHAQVYPTSSWSDNTDTTWYDASQSTFTISTAEAFAGLSELVAQGNTLAGKTLTINANIDLDAHLWTPIGTGIDNPFSGTIDGGNNTISNLWINLPNSSFVGLFGQASGATISNIKIDNAQVLALDTAAVLVGNFSTNSAMQDCHITNSTITATDYNIGGITGGILTNSTMTRCSFIGDVSGLSQVGGVSGTAYNNTEISECYSEGSVSGGYLIGGVVGYCTFAFGGTTENIIDNCYSRSNISANSGRAGGVYGGAEFTLTLLNSYATGTVTAPEYQGGVIGAFGGGPIVIQNTFFDTETSQNTEGVGGFLAAPADYDIEGRTTADMKTAELVDLLNAGSAESPWTIDPNLNDGYPVLNSLLSVNNNTFETATVTVYPTIFTDVITVSSTVNLKSFKMYNVAGTFVFEGDITNTKTVNAETLSAGIYVMNITTENGMVTKKVIKK